MVKDDLSDSSEVYCAASSTSATQNWGECKVSAMTPDEKIIHSSF